MVDTVSVSYDISKLKPVTSVPAFDMHYNHIYTGHVNDFKNGVGDYAFNKAGAFLHEKYFENIRELRDFNAPTGKSEQVILIRYGSIENFVKTCLDQAARLQGNGWLWMNTSGYVNIIPNHRIVDNVAMVIDLWEHAYVLTHGNDRDKYIKDHFSIINWDVVNQRILEPKREK